MGDFLTHVVQAELVLERIESRRLSDGIRKRMTLYRLGAQGPDPLFFHKSFPSNGKGSLKSVGDRMHRQRTGQFLQAGFEKLSPPSWSPEWLDLAVYLSGFICHHCMDRTIHPYVNHADHNWLWGLDGSPVKVTHQELEIALDVLLWRGYGRGAAYRTDTRKLADIGKTWPNMVLAFWQDALTAVYQEQVTQEQMQEVLHHFYRGHDLLFDPKGWKKKLIIWLDSLTGGGVQPPKVPYPVAVSAELDWLNNKRRTWFNPDLPGEKRIDSIDMILGIAADDAVNLINQAFSTVFSGGSFAALFPDISYDNGLPCVETKPQQEE